MADNIMNMTWHTWVKNGSPGPVDEAWQEGRQTLQFGSRQRSSGDGGLVAEVSLPVLEELLRGAGWRPVSASVFSPR